MDDSSSRFLLLKAILLHPQRPSIDLVTLERTPIVLTLYTNALPKQQNLDLKIIKISHLSMFQSIDWFAETSVVLFILPSTSNGYSKL